MEIILRGKNEKISKKELRYMLNYFANILLGKRLSNNVYLKLVFRPLSKNLWGLCAPLDYDEKYHREFEMFVDPNISKFKQIITIAHEMVHIMQYAKNQLKLLHGDDYRWMGKKVTIPDKHYKKMPWEMEANRSERYLSQFYSEHLKQKNIKFDK